MARAQTSTQAMVDTLIGKVVDMKKTIGTVVVAQQLAS